MKPDWKDAPPYAQFLAQDESGRWAWYELPPVAQHGHGYWSVFKGKWAHADEKVEEREWFKTLEPRP